MNGITKRNRSKYSTGPTKGESTSVKKWEDFRDVDFAELFEYGKNIASEEEAKVIRDKIEKQRELVEEQKLEALKRSVV